ncbi:hypothetical protein GWI72_10485 [Microvirga tunisiensis]|uniref:Uncharacterized protein n=2 Tax=Pannonibacter tanglangensis TaxID=2750084 RepID=A0A7X5F2Q8_9HYPH|nr:MULTISPECIES: hypothetical protein [unclassified Pannonibacter]NBN64159.1 hypothetical protein [Pannonibacter sp. XCT-34]NBN78693.1 hypothetical protein [Pannonibacter sp. XCT-53]
MSEVALSRLEAASARLGADRVSREVLRYLCARHEPGARLRLNTALMARDLGHPTPYVALALVRLSALRLIDQRALPGLPYQLSEFSLLFLEEAD